MFDTEHLCCRVEHPSGDRRTRHPEETSGRIGGIDHLAAGVGERGIGDRRDDTGGPDRDDDIPGSGSYAQRRGGVVTSAWADHRTTTGEACWLEGFKNARNDSVVAERPPEQVLSVFTCKDRPVASTAGIAAVCYQRVNVAPSRAAGW